MPGSIQCSLPNSASWRQPLARYRRDGEIDHVSTLAAFSSQRFAAAKRLLGHPLLHTVRLSHQSLERRGWRVAAAAHSRGSLVYRRLLARPVVDDAARVAPADVFSHADL